METMKACMYISLTASIDARAHHFDQCESFAVVEMAQHLDITDVGVYFNSLGEIPPVFVDFDSEQTIFCVFIALQNVETRK